MGEVGPNAVNTEYEINTEYDIFQFHIFYRLNKIMRVVFPDELDTDEGCVYFKVQ